MIDRMTSEQDSAFHEVFAASNSRPSDWYERKPYRVVRAHQLPQLESLVGHLLIDGWTPLGSPSSNFFKHSNGNVQLVFLQGMWRGQAPAPARDQKSPAKAPL